MVRGWFFFCLLALLGCAGPTTGPEIDLAAERDSLLKADAALFAAHEEIEAFLDHFADDATFMPADAPLARGEAIRSTWEQLLGLPGFELSWRAASAHVAEAGDLGYTLGSYELTVAPEGTPRVTVGKYVTVWKKQPDGSWKVVVDCFNADAPPTAG